MIRSTIPEGIVFSRDYLDSVDSIVIVVGFNFSKMLRIYKFKNKNKEFSLLTQIDSIKWDSYEHTGGLFEEWRECCIIESTFLIDKMTKNELNEVLLRFCLKEEGEGRKDKIKVIEIKNDGKWEIKKEVEVEKEERNDIDDDYKNKPIELEGFQENRIILKRRIDRNRWLLSLLDVEATNSNVGEFKYIND